MPIFQVYSLFSYTLLKKVASSCPTLCYNRLHSPWSSPGQKTGVGSLSLLQRIFQTRGLNRGLPYCRQILYQLSHKGSPTLLKPRLLHNANICILLLRSSIITCKGLKILCRFICTLGELYTTTDTNI